MTENLLELEGIRYSYPDSAWSLEIDRLGLGPEKITGIVGPNGSGKSTLLRIAAGLITPQRGSVRLKGQPITGLKRRQVARTLGFLPQEVPQLFDFSVDQVVRMGRYAHLRPLSMETPEDRRIAEQALAAVELSGVGHRTLSHLSGGERRRVLIASVLAQQPEILLLDEPTNALDIHHAASIMRLLTGLGRKGPTVVIVTHDINLAALFCERLLLLTRGRIQADGSPEEVISPERMLAAYGEELLIRKHPQTGGPMVLPSRSEK